MRVPHRMEWEDPVSERLHDSEVECLVRVCSGLPPESPGREMWLKETLTVENLEVSSEEV